MKAIQIKWIVRAAAAAVIGAGCAVYAPFAAFSFSVWTVVKFLCFGAAGLLLTFGLTGKISRRLLWFAVPLSFVLALTFTIGAQLQVYETLFFTLPGIASFFGIWALSFLLLCHLFETVPAWLAPKHQLRPLSNTVLLLSVFILFCAFASLWLFSFYPIMTNYDIHAHLSQIASGEYETHHSLLYTLLMQGLLWLASALQLTDTWGFLMLGLLQMTVMGLSMGYALTTLNRTGADRRAVLLAAAYYCLFPLFGYFAFSTTKDTLFACFLMLTGLELYRLARGEKSAILRMTLFGVLMCLFRYNGTLTLLLFAAGTAVYVLLLIMRHRRLSQLLKRVIVVLPVILVLQSGASSLLTLATGAVTPDTVKRDMLSLPLQQMARVLQTAEDEEAIARIEGLFGVDDIAERYRADIADPVKACFLYPDENYISALRAWAKYSVQYPVEYIEAFLELTRGAWFIDDLSHTKIDYWLDYTGYLETTQKYEEDDFSIEYQSFLPALKTFLENAFMDNDYLDVPLIRYLFALGVQTWIVLIALCFAVYRRQTISLPMLLFALCTLLPIFLLPCMISRYFLPLFLLNPLCLTALTVQKETAHA